MGALRLLLGERADRSLIRTGESQCTVLAEFGLSNSKAVNTVLEGLGHEPCEGGLLIIRRVITESASRNLVNDEPVTLQVLKRWGEVLVDMHGPSSVTIRSGKQLDIWMRLEELKKKRIDMPKPTSRLGI